MKIDKFKASSDLLFCFHKKQYRNKFLEQKKMPMYQLHMNEEKKYFWKFYRSYYQSIISMATKFFFLSVSTELKHGTEDENCKGRKKSKAWISILFCCKDACKRMLKSLDIGISAKPHIFKNVINCLCDYQNNTLVWMIQNFFTWLKSFY